MHSDTARSIYDMIRGAMLFTAGPLLSSSQSETSSAEDRVPRKSWFTLATAVPSVAKCVFWHSTVRTSFCNAANSRSATPISSGRFDGCDARLAFTGSSRKPTNRLNVASAGP